MIDLVPRPIDEDDSVGIPNRQLLGWEWLINLQVGDAGRVLRLDVSACQGTMNATREIDAWFALQELVDLLGPRQGGIIARVGLNDFPDQVVDGGIKPYLDVPLE